MKHYDSINRIQDDGFLIGKSVWAFTKLDGQNFAAKYNPKKNVFDTFGSRNRMVDENDEQFGDAVRYFKNSNIPSVLSELVKKNKGKGGIFAGVDEITFFFEWYGEHSFAGRHDPSDELRLYLIDVFLKKKGYIEPKPYYEIFCEDGRLDVPQLIYKGVLTNAFVKDIQENDWTQSGCKYPAVKEGVVCRLSSILKGQRMPKVKFKTKWWMTKLHEMYTEEECKLLE